MLLLGIAGRAVYRNVREHRAKSKTSGADSTNPQEQHQHRKQERYFSSENTGSPSVPPPAYNQSTVQQESFGTNLAPTANPYSRSHSPSASSARSWVLSAPLAIFEFFPLSNEMPLPVLPVNSDANIILLTYPAGKFTSRQVDYANALPHTSPSDPPNLVLNGRVDASYSRDLGSLIAKDASTHHPSASANVSITKTPDGGISVSGPTTATADGSMGSLAVLAIRYDPMTDANLVREVITLGRWQGGEAVVAIPPVTSERDAGCETICVVQERGGGWIASGSEA